MSDVTLIGIDLGKHSFHLHGQDKAQSRVRSPDRKRSLTLPMIWKLHKELGIPAENLIQPPASPDEL